MADKKKKKDEETWEVEVSNYISSKDCPDREKQRGGYVCAETGKRCKKKNCYWCFE